MLELNWADYTIISILFLSTAISFIRGFVKEAMSLASWVIAVWVGLQFADDMSYLLRDAIHTPQLRVALAFFILFLASLVLGAILNYIIGQLLAKTCLRGTDRVLGMVFGLGRGTIIVSLLVLVAAVSSAPESSWWQQSQLIPQFKHLAIMINHYLPESVAVNVG